jgi:hypothetical protein
VSRLYFRKKFILILMLMMMRSLAIKSVMLNIVTSSLLFMGSYAVLSLVALTLGIYRSKSASEGK